MIESSPDCLFCKIVAGEIPAEVVHATESTLAFRDVDPQAPTHVLVIPASHYRDAGDLALHEPATAAEMLVVAAEVAEKAGLGDGYRLVFNTGAGGGQVVFHAHLHVIGGRPMGWPPG
ncbi:histidine triad nucleotide-binding protein [Nocardioides seonyuensis]|uniref:Histidine triad nucleotide-binding protein n=1 Tax=Nocardioides seonyuensis TaxID=2518371 RepID=A0A4P7IIL9_9ACTN|nr:histidine triad nucleotide-binding protein [Nocardioides seonyuensis]QBX56593.1 histidine triad nucleotide-binding protein [Nocardioides seonyuensis]